VERSANVRQKAVRTIVNELVQGDARVVVFGDLNEGPTVADTQAPNLTMLFENNSPLIDCYSLLGFDLGNRPGNIQRLRLAQPIRLHLYFEELAALLPIRTCF
jgi:hypothetical protein